MTASLLKSVNKVGGTCRDHKAAVQAVLSSENIICWAKMIYSECNGKVEEGVKFRKYQLYEVFFHCWHTWIDNSV